MREKTKETSKERYDGFRAGIDQSLTGSLLRRRIDGAGIKVRDVQHAMGFEHPQSIYRWFSGQALPSVDNLYILHTLLELPMEEILVTTDRPQRLRCAAYLVKAHAGPAT